VPTIKQEENYSITRSGPFYRLPSNGKGHSDMSSNIHIFSISKEDSAVPTSIIVRMGEISSSDTSDIANVSINNHVLN